MHTFETEIDINILFFMFPNSFRMQHVGEHYRNYTKTVRDSISNRKQQFDWWSQYYSLTHNPELGEKLPSYVKFPKLSNELDSLPRSHPWAQHRLGKYNGLYFIPTEKDTETCRHCSFQNVVMKEITRDFFNHPLFAILSKGLNYMYLKIDTTECWGHIQLTNAEVNIMQETADLNNISK